MSDPEILQAIRDGRDHAAFTALYVHLPKVIRLVKANSGGRDEAKDIFQDALVIFHRKARTEGFTLTSSISTFLFAICRNLWREELRRRDRSLTDWKLEGLPDEPADLTALLAREGEYRTAEQALRSLGEKCLEVLKRFYILHEPLTQIARALGFAGEGAAKTRKYKCLEEARRRYRQLVDTNTIQHA
ncbi:MAG: sigma-70 family RNA polymerase sigma factor [Flavobacteriales bacterium]|nr:sigma-70 family RNA polymerase sigma factor [Flavobacteriales bacterium]